MKEMELSSSLGSWEDLVKQYVFDKSLPPLPPLPPPQTNKPKSWDIGMIFSILWNREIEAQRGGFALAKLPQLISQGSKYLNPDLSSFNASDTLLSLTWKNWKMYTLKLRND